MNLDTRQWSGLLHLMSVMVLADGRVMEEEIRVFVFRMKELRRKLAPDMMFSEGLVRDWFTAHRDAIADGLSTDYAACVEASLSAFDGFADRKMLVETLNAVARADGHRHPSELTIITQAAERWNVKVPRK